MIGEAEERECDYRVLGSNSRGTYTFGIFVCITIGVYLLYIGGHLGKVAGRQFSCLWSCFDPTLRSPRSSQKATRFEGEDLMW